MNIVIHSDEPLVFRDGRPFGDTGLVDGGVLDWPRPATVMGVLRTRVGLSRSSDFFEKENPDWQENITSIKLVTAKRICPLWQCYGENRPWQYLFPAPADAAVIPGRDSTRFCIEAFDYADPFASGGVDLPWRNWRVPIAATVEKPSEDRPGFWKHDAFLSWLNGRGATGEVASRDLGVAMPRPEARMHTAIDPATGTVLDGRLFASWGLRLATMENENQEAGRLGIGVALIGTAPGDAPFGPCRFGGERRTAVVDALETAFPPCPDWFEGCRFLRLVLISPGDFGAWAPPWLLPDAESGETDWRTVPRTDIRIRLCSAHLPRWQPVSGWDYVRRGPKAMRKLVPAGAVYVVELEDPAQAQSLAGTLWGRSLAENLADPDGCGAVCVGTLNL